MKFTLKEIVLAGIFAALTAICAQIGFQTPFATAPITLEVFAVFLAGVLLGSKVGTFSQIVFLLLGVCGLPVFAHFKSGLGVLFGHTGGYLLSFPIMTFVIGYIIKRKKQVSRMDLLGIMLIGLIICYTLGTIQLAFVLKLSAVKAISVGIIPYIPFDILKIFAASYLGFQVRNSLIKAKLLN